MALLLKNNNYLVIDENGYYVVFKNTSTRKKFKKAARAYEVLAKYDELLYNLINDEENRYYNTIEYHQQISELEEERIRFLNAAKTFDNTGSFPLIEKYFPNVTEAIPAVIDRGHVCLHTETEEEMYELVKKLELFDIVKDC